MVENKKWSPGQAVTANVGVLIALVAAAATGGCLSSQNLSDYSFMAPAVGAATEIANATDSTAPEPAPQTVQ